jgi:hypothetical protein
VANYIAHARSNYFRVNDEVAFNEWARGLGLVVTPLQEGPELAKSHEFFMIYPDPEVSEDGGWPYSRFDEQTDEDEDIDFEAELQPHLREGTCAILIEVGHEKLRYLIAVARVIPATGESRFFDLNDIALKEARKFDPQATEAVF